jgi:hypothetical protein
MQAKKQYVTPTVKEHGVVRELTQTGSGNRKKHETGLGGRPKNGE